MATYSVNTTPTVIATQTTELDYLNTGPQPVILRWPAAGDTLPPGVTRTYPYQGAVTAYVRSGTSGITTTARADQGLPGSGAVYGGTP